MKKNIINLTLVFITLIGASSCEKKGCTDELASNYSEEAEQDDGSCVYGQFDVTYDFKFMFNDEEVSIDDLADIKYTNANGENLSITKLQYSISDFSFYLEGGESIVTDEYHLVDIEDLPTLMKKLSTQLVAGKYTGLGFNYGFNEEDNVDGAYADLNLKSWSSPVMLGGGYHQLKFEGNFIDDAGVTTSFQYHNLSAIRQIAGEDTTFHSNYREIKFDNKDFNVNSNKTITIVMHIDQWFENPNLWDLNELHTMLMPNYGAQLLMTENANNVFEVSSIE
jgi:hypothetical protein